MWETLQGFLKTLSGESPANTFSPDDPRVAVAALCIQIMRADGRIDDAERAQLERLLKEHYKLTDETLAAVVKAGEDAESEAVDYYHFTSIINRTLAEEEKVALVGFLWDITYADGDRNEMEDHIVWRVTDLLGVSGRERIIQRQEAEARRREEEASNGAGE